MSVYIARVVANCVRKRSEFEWQFTKGSTLPGAGHGGLDPSFRELPKRAFRRSARAQMLTGDAGIRYTKTFGKQRHVLILQPNLSKKSQRFENSERLFIEVQWEK